MGALKQF